MKHLACCTLAALALVLLAESAAGATAVVAGVTSAAGCRSPNTWGTKQCCRPAWFHDNADHCGRVRLACGCRRGQAGKGQVDGGQEYGWRLG